MQTDPLLSFEQYLGFVKWAIHKSRFIISRIFQTFKSCGPIKRWYKENNEDMHLSGKFFAQKITVRE